MAGDWIKMRMGLVTHPKVVRISSALNADKLRAIGALFATWSLFDLHSEDGILRGYTPEILDDELRFPGFSEQMQAIGWLEVTKDGHLQMPRFEEHNGSSSKRRATEASRKNVVRKVSAKRPQNVRIECGQNADQRREEKNRDIDSHAPRAREEGVVSSAEIPARQTVKAYADRIGLPEWKAEMWFNDMEATGWSYKGQRVRNWKAMLANVKTYWEADGRPSGPQSRQPNRKSATDGVPHDAISKFGV